MAKKFPLTCAFAYLAKLGRVRTKLRSSAGFTLTEMLACVVLVGLLSLCLATGVQFASKSYANSVTQSQAQSLASTLTNAVQDEVRYAIPTTKDGKLSYISSTFGAAADGTGEAGSGASDEPSAKRAGGLVFDTNNGKLTVNGKEKNLIAESAYPNDVFVVIDKFEYDDADPHHTFTVQLSIYRNGDVPGTDDSLVTSKFQARPLNG